jgi:hypothetical protein
MRPIHVWRSHFSYCNHNIRGSGLKLKNRWCWLYYVLIIHCVAYIVAEPIYAMLSFLILPDIPAWSRQTLWQSQLIPPASVLHVHACVLTVLPDHACVLTVLPDHACVLTVLPSHACFLTVLTDHACVLTAIPNHACILTVLSDHTCLPTVLPDHACVLTVHPDHACLPTVLPDHACVVPPLILCFCSFAISGDI